MECLAVAQAGGDPEVGRCHRLAGEGVDHLEDCGVKVDSTRQHCRAENTSRYQFARQVPHVVGVRLERRG
jgi:hypothetical protein